MRIAPGRVSLVTGAAAGLGLGIVERLVAEGVRVAASDIDVGGLRSVSDRLGPRVIDIEADVRSEAEMDDAVGRTIDAFGSLDTLVLAAGTIGGGGIETTSASEWARVLDVNLTGAFLAAKAAVPALRASGRGRIVAISSDAGRRGFAGGQAYCASKFGLIGLIESIAAELARSGVTANCVCPIGVPTTPMGQAILAKQVAASGRTPEELLAARASGVPLGRNATVDDVVNAAMYFISDDAAFLTGLSLDVNGGRHLGRGVLTPWQA